MGNIDWLIKTLSEEQRRVIDQSTSNAAILASAGSGKTRTLVHLLARDLLAGIPPTGIIAFTFTEKASEELLARVHMLIKQNAPALSLEGMFIGTIHSWCFQFLLRQSDFYNFTSMDELHNDSLVSRLYDYLDLENAYGLSYPRGVNRFLADIEVYYNENLKDTDIPSNVRESLNRFLKLIQQNRLLTFGSMIRNTIDYLHTNGHVPGLESLFIDEYQDVNPAQVSLIKAMISDEGKVNVVGDELQCIFNWRGSDVKRLLNFPNEFNNVSAGIRLYSAKVVNRLKFIRRLRVLGFTIEEIKTCFDSTSEPGTRKIRVDRTLKLLNMQREKAQDELFKLANLQKEIDVSIQKVKACSACHTKKCPEQCPSYGHIL